MSYADNAAVAEANERKPRYRGAFHDSPVYNEPLVRRRYVPFSADARTSALDTNEASRKAVYWLLRELGIEHPRWKKSRAAKARRQV